MKTWTQTSVQHLVRHKTGRYYARLFNNGKESWKTLGTDVLEVAKIKLRDVAGEAQKVIRASAAHERGRMTVGDCSVIFTARLNDGFGLKGRGNMMRRISPGSIHYRQQTLDALFQTWPELATMDVRKVSQAECEQWARKFSKGYSPTRYNNTLDTLRALLDIAVDAGARVGNPARKVGRLSVKPKSLVLPEREQFMAFVEAIRTAGAWCSKDCADFVQFLAFTGARKDEAANVLWSDVDLVRNRVHLRITKGSTPRFVPLIGDAKALLTRMRERRAGESPSANVLRVKEAQKAMDKAAKAVRISRITHHDLRHLFATTCIENGIDIPTVSKWLGHKDGGVLAMKTYGHLRDEHSAAAATRVTFAPIPPATNVVPMVGVA